MSQGLQGARPSRLAFALTWFINPYVQIVVGSLLVTGGEIFLKKGASAAGAHGGATGIFGIAALVSGWTWIGIVSYVLSLASWLHVLRSVPLSVAFPLINVVHVLVPLGAAVFLHEHVSAKRWLGISLIVLGVLAIIKPLVRAGQEL